MAPACQSEALMLILALSKDGERALALAIAAAIALGVWLLVLVVLALVTRPDLPAATAATSELGGKESPAVAGFLVNRWEVGREAVPATLLDLAARKVVDIDQVAPDRFVCRLRSSATASATASASSAASAATPGLTDYARQVLDH